MKEQRKKEEEGDERNGIVGKGEEIDKERRGMEEKKMTMMKRKASPVTDSRK